MSIGVLLGKQLARAIKGTGDDVADETVDALGKAPTKKESQSFRDEFTIEAAHGQADTDEGTGVIMIKGRNGKLREFLVEFEPGLKRVSDENLGVNKFLDYTQKNDTLDPNEIGTWFGGYDIKGEPDIANFFAERYGKGAVYPVLLKIKNPKKYDNYFEFEEAMAEWGDTTNSPSATGFIEHLKKQGYDAIEIERSRTDTGELRTDYVPFASNQIRSVFAKFDPSKRDSGNIMASVGSGLIGGTAMINSSKDKKDSLVERPKK